MTLLQAIMDTGQAEHIVACIPKYHIVVLKNILAYSHVELLITIIVRQTIHNHLPFLKSPYKKSITCIRNTNQT